MDNPDRLKWLDPPSRDALDTARSLLRSLDALHVNGTVTDQGKEMAALPVHPRLAYMMVAASRLGKGGAACDLAALIVERDVIRFEPALEDADMQIRFDLLRAARRKKSLSVPGGTINPSALDRAIRLADHFRRRLGCRAHDPRDLSIGRLLAWAYPDRVAQGRKGKRGKFHLINGRGAYLNHVSAIASEAYLIAVDLDGNRREARIFRAAACDMNILMEQFEGQIGWDPVVDWDPEREAVTARRNLKLGALVLRSEPLPRPDTQQITTALLKGIRQQGIGCLPWTKALRRWQDRVCFLRRVFRKEEPWPDVSDAGLESQLNQWLTPYLSGMTRLRDLARIELKTILFSMLSHSQHQLLGELAPTHLTVPSGSRIPIDYSGDIPVLAVRLQEMFGLDHTPTVAKDRHSLLIHLLSPAGRPVQITRDLAGFWQTAYLQVKKELKGRYPKHYWPDDPLQAEATARAKPRRT